MSWRKRLARRRIFDAGGVFVAGLLTWVRGLPVALAVVVGAGAIPWTCFVEEHPVQRYADVEDAAAVAYTNTPAATWMCAALLFDAGDRREAIRAGLASLAICYAATGLLAALLFHRFGSGHWRGTSVMALLRMAAFAAFAAFVIGLSKAVALALCLPFGEWGMLVIVPFATIAELWLVCEYWLVLPILAIERVPISTAMRRSRKLTRGSRAGVLGVQCGALFVSAVGSVLLVPVAYELADSLAGRLAPTAVLATTLQAALLAEGYSHLQTLREGPDARAVARVFE